MSAKNQKSLEEIMAERKKLVDSKIKTDTASQPLSPPLSSAPSTNPPLPPKIPKQPKGDVTIEIDWNAFKQHVCQNHAISNGNGDELIIFNKFFKPYSKGNSKSLTSVGRENSLFEAMKRVFERHAKDFVVKVIKEKVI